MVIEATYDDGTKAVVDGYTLSTNVATLTGGRITVSFGGKTTSFRITVKAAEEKPDEPVIPDDPPVSSDTEEPAPSEKKGCRSVISVSGAVFGLAVAAVVLLKKKEENV